MRDQGLGLRRVDLQPLAHDVLPVVRAAAAKNDALDQFLVRHIDRHDMVDLAPVEDLLERSGLRRGARIAVEQEAHGRVRLA